VIAPAGPLIVTEPVPLPVTVAPLAEPSVIVPLATLRTVDSESPPPGFVETDNPPNAMPVFSLPL
jgi:hypothetical protein